MKPNSQSDENPTRLDYWKLIDRVTCSGDVSATDVVVLMRLLQHRNTETGRCDPSIWTLAKRLFPKLTAASGYNKVWRSIQKLKKEEIIRVIHQHDSSSIYQFDFGWGYGLIDTSLSLSDEEKGFIKTMKTKPGFIKTMKIHQNNEDPSIKTMKPIHRNNEDPSIKRIELNNKGNNKRNNKRNRAADAASIHICDSSHERDASSVANQAASPSAPLRSAEEASPSVVFDLRNLKDNLHDNKQAATSLLSYEEKSPVKQSEYATTEPLSGNITDKSPECSAAAGRVADAVFEKLCDICPNGSKEDARHQYDRVVELGHDPIVILATLHDTPYCDDLVGYLRSGCWMDLT